jgi:hypothetical protein
VQPPARIGERHLRAGIQLVGGQDRVEIEKARLVDVLRTVEGPVQIELARSRLIVLRRPEQALERPGVRGRLSIPDAGCAQDERNSRRDPERVT